MPQVFGRYLLVQRLSRGGMGEIFLAKHGLAGFEKLAVIKKVLPHLAADAQFISRFVDEAQVAIKLQHVNVAQVFEVGRVGDEYFLALEYVEGRDLRRTLALLGHLKTRLPVDLALFIGRELANGLAYAHRRTGTDGSSLNLVHCDISPPNVLVSFEGETKVIDFGIAKSAIRGTATDPKMGFGKFGYMAPEQLIRGGMVDHRTDIYAAGVVLFELVTGQRLYEAGPEPDYRALAKKVAKGEHPLPSEIDPALAPYDDLVATALNPKPEDRYQSAAEFRDAIQQCLVAVNPTISTDQLGAYMRELFNEEMTAQKELHERVAKAHLADFHEQFHTQTISTVSFALAQLPLQAPDTGNTPKQIRPRPTAPSQALRPSPALDTVAPPTEALRPATAVDDLPLADGTGTGVRLDRARRRKLAIAGAGLTFVLAAAITYAMTRSTDKPRPPPIVAGTDPGPLPKQSAIIVEPINPPPTQQGTVKGSDAGEIEMPSEQVPDHHAGSNAHKPPHDPHHGGAGNQHVVKDHATPPTPPVTNAVTKEMLTSKFQGARREYDAYKQKYGSRLEKEWGDLTTYIQYMPPSVDDAGRKEAARRIDEFRIRMKE